MQKEVRSYEVLYEDHLKLTEVRIEVGRAGGDFEGTQELSGH